MCKIVRSAYIVLCLIFVLVETTYIMRCLASLYLLLFSQGRDNIRYRHVTLSSEMTETMFVVVTITTDLLLCWYLTTVLLSRGSSKSELGPWAEAASASAWPPSPAFSHNATTTLPKPLFGRQWLGLNFSLALVLTLFSVVIASILSLSTLSAIRRFDSSQLGLILESIASSFSVFVIPEALISVVLWRRCIRISAELRKRPPGPTT